MSDLSSQRRELEHLNDQLRKSMSLLEEYQYNIREIFASLETGWGDRPELDKIRAEILDRMHDLDALTHSNEWLGKWLEANIDMVYRMENCLPAKND